MKKRIKSRLGYMPDISDIRDHRFIPDETILQNLPPAVELTPGFPVYDQGRLGSCTANALSAAVQYQRAKHKELPDFIPSRLFIYYNERVIEGSKDYDSGAMLRDGIKSLHKLGVCSENEWPYDDTPPVNDGGVFPDGAKAKKKPTATCYKDALNFTITSYERVHQDITHLKSCLAGGFPFVFGFTVYDNWLSETNIPSTQIPLPTKRDKPVGGHAVLCVGYDDSTQLFRIRNSWGDNVGDKGYFFMPYEYLTNKNLSGDFWVIYTVKN